MKTNHFKMADNSLNLSTLRKTNLKIRGFVFYFHKKKFIFLKYQFKSLCMPFSFQMKKKNNVLTSKLTVNIFKGEKC